MKRLLLLCAFLVSVSLLPSAAQTKRRSTTVPRQPTAAPDTGPTQLIFISGKVVSEDGLELTESASIQSICHGQKHTETHTDARGYFSLQLGGRFGSPSIDPDFDAESDSRTGRVGKPDNRDLRDCDLQASLAGFTSDLVALGGRFTGGENADIGRIVLHRIGGVEGFTVSATTAQAPGAAKKALQHGQQKAKEGKLDDAQKSLEKAVSLYPKFAVAWFELGRVQIQKQDVAGAKQSFLKSVEADARYLNPYSGLTQIALREQHWQEALDASEKLLALNPINFPEMWFSNGVANYCLEHFAAAEKSARRGLEIDTEHHVPRLEYLLGMVLIRKPDYQEAERHLRTFLQMSTQSKDIEEAQKQLSDLARLTAAKKPNPGPSPE